MKHIGKERSMRLFVACCDWAAERDCNNTLKTDHHLHCHFLFGVKGASLCEKQL